MVVSLSGSMRHNDPTQFVKLFERRTQIFVDNLGWSLATRNGMEIDQYDTNEAQYFFHHDANGNIESHFRLSPTISHSLTADCFSHLVDPTLQLRDALVWEGTRYFVQPASRGRYVRRRLESGIFCQAFEWCLSQGISLIQAVLETSVLPTIRSIAPQTYTIGLPSLYCGGHGVRGGGEAVAIRIPINVQTVAEAKSYGTV